MTGEEGRSTAEELRRGLRYLQAATVAVFLLLVGLGVYVWLDGKDTKDALCAYRADLNSRVVQSTEFLRDHPNGSKAFGITREQLLTNIANQQRVIKAFSGLNCHTPESAPAETTTPKERDP